MNIFAPVEIEEFCFLIDDLLSKTQFAVNMSLIKNEPENMRKSLINNFAFSSRVKSRLFVVSVSRSFDGSPSEYFPIRSMNAILTNCEMVWFGLRINQLKSLSITEGELF